MLVSALVFGLAPALVLLTLAIGGVIEVVGGAFEAIGDVRSSAS